VSRASVGYCITLCVLLTACFVWADPGPAWTADSKGVRLWKISELEHLASDRPCFAVLGEGLVWGFDATSGRTVWTRKIVDQDHLSSLYAIRGGVLLGGGRSTRLLSWVDGTEIWTVHLGGFPILAHDGILVLKQGGEPEGAVALSTTDGEVRYRREGEFEFDFPAEDTRVLGEVAGNFTGSAPHIVQFYRVRDGVTTCKLEIDIDPAWVIPVSQDRHLVQEGFSCLCLLSLPNGSVKLICEDPDSVYSKGFVGAGGTRYAFLIRGTKPNGDCWYFRVVDSESGVPLSADPIPLTTATPYLTVDEYRAYVVVDRNEVDGSFVRAYRLADGNVDWEFTLRPTKAFLVAPAFLVGPWCIVQACMGVDAEARGQATLWFLRRESGTLEAQIEDACAGTPSFTSGILALLSRDGILRAYRIE